MSSWCLESSKTEHQSVSGTGSNGFFSWEIIVDTCSGNFLGLEGPEILGTGHANRKQGSREFPYFLLLVVVFLLLSPGPDRAHKISVAEADLLFSARQGWDGMGAGGRMVG